MRLGSPPFRNLRLLSRAPRGMLFALLLEPRLSAGPSRPEIKSSAPGASGECGVGTGRPRPLFLPRKRWLIRGRSLSAPEPAEQPHCEAGLVPVPPRLSLRLGDTKPSRFVGWNQGSPTCRTGAWRKHPTSDETRSLTRSAGCPSGASGRSGRFERLHHSHRRDRQAFGQPSGKNPSQSSNLGQLPGCGEAGRSL